MIGVMSEAAEPVRRTLTQEEVDAVCLKHDRLWQARPGGARAVFAWMDLSGVSLRGRNLADADFTAACLIGCDLTGAKLDNANFFGADMQDATLVDASLHYQLDGMRLALNASNLLDKEYDTSCSEVTCYYGYGRTLTASASYSW